jgi:hypothetical protein
MPQRGVARRFVAAQSVAQHRFPVRTVAVLWSGQESQGCFGDRVQRVGAASAFAKRFDPAQHGQ